MACQKTKRASLISLPHTKKFNFIWFLSLIPILVKKTTLSQFLPTQISLSYHCHIIIRDLFEKEIDSMYDRNYDENEAVIDKFFIEDLNDNDDNA